MARKMIKVRVCDRCPVGRENKATRVEVIGIGTSRYELELCEDCGKKLDRDMYQWGRLGKQLEDVPMTSSAAVSFITADYVMDSRRAAELRSKQNAVTPAAAPEPAIVTESRGYALPPTAGDWTFTEHARERMEERGIRVVDALRAACSPQVLREGNRPNTMVQEAQDTKVVVNLATKEILTVARPSRETQREAM